MRILTHWPLEKFDLAATSRNFVEQQHLVDVVARQTIWRGNQQPIELMPTDGIPQAIQAGPTQMRSTVAVVPKDMVVRQIFLLLCQEHAELIQLLVNRLLLHLVGRCNAHVHA